MTKEFNFKKVLVFSAHPDDLDFGCAGTVAKLTSEGKEVVYCIITDGRKGVQKKEHFGMEGKKISAIREREQRAAAKTVGVNKVIFLKEKDGELENTSKVREKIAKAIRIEKPDLVFAFDPASCTFENFYRCHRDHRMGAEAVFDAIYPGAGSPVFFPSLAKAGIAPHQIKGIWFYATEKPNIFIDISKTIERKIAALTCHDSQFKDIGEVPKFIKLRAKEAGKKKGMKYAETFRELML